MITPYLKKITIFFAISLLGIVGIIISSLILINHNGMNHKLQGWVNLLWLPLLLIILIIDRTCVWKFGTKKVNKVQLNILGTLILLFIINFIRLQL